MFAENWLMFPYFQSYPQELQQLQDFCYSQRPNVSMGNLSPSSTISEYDLGGEGDLFKAPEPIIEELVMSLDPTVTAISMMSCGDDLISSQGLEISEIESTFENEQLLCEMFYECKKDLLAQEATDTPQSEVLDFNIPFTRTDENLIAEEKVISQGQFQKSCSSGSLSSMDHMPGATLRPNFPNFPGMDLGADYGMRRAFSEGDIKALGNGSESLIQLPPGQPQVSSICATEDRKEKLNRYRNKKSKRNFSRKIKVYVDLLPSHISSNSDPLDTSTLGTNNASSTEFDFDLNRKALADSQPRIRGRFARTEDVDVSKNH